MSEHQSDMLGRTGSAETTPGTEEQRFVERRRAVGERRVSVGDRRAPFSADSADYGDGPGQFPDRRRGPADRRSAAWADRRRSNQDAPQGRAGVVPRRTSRLTRTSLDRAIIFGSFEIPDEDDNDSGGAKRPSGDHGPDLTP